jgi:hypothetical protein
LCCSSNSGVEAKWQNGVAEGAIGLAVSRARTMMLHVSLHWPDVDDETLWHLALNHAAYLHNHTPNPVLVAIYFRFTSTPLLGFTPAVYWLF